MVKKSSSLSKKKVSIEYKISLAETDSVGVVYFANYLMLFEKAHMEYLFKAGIDNASLIKEGIFMPITEAHCNLKMPLHYGDNVTIEVFIKQLKKISLIFEYNVTKNNNPKITASGYTVHIFTNRNFKPIKIPSSIETPLKEFLHV